MSEARTEKPAKPPVRQRQTIKLNEATNEAVPRKGAKRRTEPGHDAPAVSSSATPTDNMKEPSHAR